MIAKHKRIKLSQKKYKELKQKVLERDKYCVLCGAVPTDLHHVKYRSQGGDDSENNCVMLCKDCHDNKAHGVNNRKIRKELEEYLSVVNNGGFK